MRRRDFIVLAAAVGATEGLPRAVFGQQGRKVPRVAIVTGLSIPEPNGTAGRAIFDVMGSFASFLPEFARLGFTEGQTVVIERYSAPPADAPHVMQAVVASTPDMIITVGTGTASLSVLAFTTRIPILVGIADPIGSGIITTLAPTRRNLAVVSGTASSDFEGNNLALLAEAVPTARRAGYFTQGTEGQLAANYQNYVRIVSDAASKLGLSLTTIPAGEAVDEVAFRAAVARAVSAKAEIMQLGRSNIVSSSSELLARLMLENRMPAISNYHPFSRAGGLMSYGQRDGEQYQKVAGYAAMILNGTDPGTLPVLQPEVFDMIVNMTTAKTLGLSIPTTLLVKATQVVE